MSNSLALSTTNSLGGLEGHAIVDPGTSLKAGRDLLSGERIPRGATPRTRADLVRSYLRNALTKVKHRVLPPIKPAKSSGREFDRFRQTEHSLTCWSDTQMQWWYFTGNLHAKCGRLFSFHLVFFKRRTDFDYLGVIPAAWLKPELFAGHLSLLATSNEAKRSRFRYWQRGGFFSGGKAMAAHDRMELRLAGWSATRDGHGIVTLNVQETEVEMSLELRPEKALVFHGQNGYSQRDEEPGFSSYHCSQSRMAAEGRLFLQGETLEVRGLSWIDHEKMLAARERFTHGWDWFAIQLDQKEELMIYLLHNPDGSVNQDFSFGTYIDNEGKATHLRRSDLRVQVLEYWTSPVTGGRYPIRSEVCVPRLEMHLEVAAVFPACELDCAATTFVAYWEGPIRVHGKRRDTALSGVGYLELCGYDRRARMKLLQFMATPEPYRAVRGEAEARLGACR